MTRRSGYSILRQDARPEYWTGMRMYGVEREALLAGAPLEDLKDPVRVVLSALGEGYSDFLERPCFVVSDAMRHALDRVRVDNIQYFAAQLEIELMDEPLSGYWLGNVIGTVACVDRELSTFEPRHGSEQGDLRGFEIDPSLTYDFDLFRLAEDPRLVVVSKRVRTALEATTLRGLLFQETASYDGYPVSSEPERSEG